MEIIPFGKYKGQPIEAMMHDKQYIDWLVQQDWFKQRYQNLNTIIINNFQQPAETPEHNRLQALFTDDDFVKRFLIYIKNEHLELLNSHKYDKGDSDFKKDLQTKLIDFVCAFEKSGVDVAINAIWYDDDLEYWSTGSFIEPKCGLKIEIKPSIGDDYPSILRQMQASNSNILFAESFNATTVTLDQIRKMFSSNNIIMILKDHI